MILGVRVVRTGSRLDYAHGVSLPPQFPETRLTARTDCGQPTARNAESRARNSPSPFMPTTLAVKARAP